MFSKPSRLLVALSTLVVVVACAGWASSSAQAASEHAGTQVPHGSRAGGVTHPFEHARQHALEQRGQECERRVLTPWELIHQPVEEPGVLTPWELIHQPLERAQPVTPWELITASNRASRDASCRTHTPFGSISALGPCDQQFEEDTDVEVSATANVAVSAPDQHSWEFRLQVQSVNLDTEDTDCEAAASVTLGQGQAVQLNAFCLARDATVGSHRVSAWLFVRQSGQQQWQLLDSEPSDDIEDCIWTVE